MISKQKALGFGVFVLLFAATVNAGCGTFQLIDCSIDSADKLDCPEKYCNWCPDKCLYCDSPGKEYVPGSDNPSVACVVTNPEALSNKEAAMGTFKFKSFTLDDTGLDAKDGDLVIQTSGDISLTGDLSISKNSADLKFIAEGDIDVDLTADAGNSNSGAIKFKAGGDIKIGSDDGRSHKIETDVYDITIDAGGSIYLDLLGIWAHGSKVIIDAGKDLTIDDTFIFTDNYHNIDIDVGRELIFDYDSSSLKPEIKSGNNLNIDTFKITGTNKVANNGVSAASTMTVNYCKSDNPDFSRFADLDSLNVVCPSSCSGWWAPYCNEGTCSTGYSCETSGESCACIEQATTPSCTVSATPTQITGEGPMAVNFEIDQSTYSGSSVPYIVQVDGVNKGNITVGSDTYLLVLDLEGEIGDSHEVRFISGGVESCSVSVQHVPDFDSCTILLSPAYLAEDGTHRVDYTVLPSTAGTYDIYADATLIGAGVQITGSYSSHVQLTGGSDCTTMWPAYCSDYCHVISVNSPSGGTLCYATVDCTAETSYSSCTIDVSPWMYSSADAKDVSVVVTNTGGDSGSYVLVVDGEEDYGIPTTYGTSNAESWSGTLSPGSSASLELAFPGVSDQTTYTLDVYSGGVKRCSNQFNHFGYSTDGSNYDDEGPTIIFLNGFLTYADGTPIEEEADITVEISATGFNWDHQFENIDLSSGVLNIPLGDEDVPDHPELESDAFSLQLLRVYDITVTVETDSGASANFEMQYTR